MVDEPKVRPPRSERPGSRALYYGFWITLFGTIVLGWLMWALMDSPMGFLVAAILGGGLYGFWAFMAHRVRVEDRYEHRTA